MSTSGPFRLVIGALCAAILVLSACTKKSDDCPAPADDASAKMFKAGEDDGSTDSDDGGGSANVHGGVQSGKNNEGTDTGGRGMRISDDGDDEADGEGNKKRKQSH